MVDVIRLQDHDINGVIRLLCRELSADPISLPEFRRKVLRDPNYRQEGALVARVGDQVVGFMLGILRKAPLEDAPPDLDRGWITLMAVDRAYQRRGIGGMMLEGALEFLRSGGAESAWVSPYAPNYFAPGVDEAAYPGALMFLRKHGFEEAYRPLSMEVILPIAKPRAEVKGVDISPFCPEHALSLLDLVKREFPGDWQRIVRETLAEIEEGVLSPDHLFVAAEGDGCLGFCRHEGERFGPFGVASSERGRGIGAALLSKCLGSMEAKGLNRAWFMWTDDRAAGLYARFGFREVRRFSVFRKDL